MNVRVGAVSVCLCARRQSVALAAVFAGLCLGAGAADAASGWVGLVANGSSSSDTLTPFDTSTNLPGSAIPLGGYIVASVAITPDGRTAWVADLGQEGTGNPGNLIPVDLFSDTAGSPVAIPAATTNSYCQNGNETIVAGLNTLALAPDGRTAYVTDSSTDAVYPIDLTQTPAQPGTPIVLPAGSAPTGLAVSPDGQTLYVADEATDKVSIVPLGGGAESTIALAAGAQPNAIAITPDGKTAYVVEGGLDQVIPIGLAGGQLGTPIPVGSGPSGIVITPDGKAAYVTNGGTGFVPDPASNSTPPTCSAGQAGDNTVTPVDLRTNTAAAAIANVTDASGPGVTPDASTVYAPAGGTNGASSDVTPIDTMSNEAGTPFDGGGFPEQVAVSPDQPPMANFTVQAAAAGQPTSFDASSSTVAVGSIASYAWNFGDGQTATTSTPTTTHVYSADGDYQATVTETDTAGTSTTRVFTGQMVSRNGGPSAQATRLVLVSAGPTPQVKLSTGQLDFGSVGLGHESAPQSVTITDTGSAPLTISSSAITGPDAGDFKITSDGCTHQTIAPTAFCTSGLMFAPHGDGSRSAQIAFTDNASGSPHTVALSGLGSTVGSVAGAVRAASTGQPLPGSSVMACTTHTFRSCQTATSDANGHYEIDGLQQGSWIVQVSPANPDLYDGSANVTITPGNVAGQNFALSPRWRRRAT